MRFVNIGMLPEFSFEIKSLVGSMSVPHLFCYEIFFDGARCAFNGCPLVRCDNLMIMLVVSQVKRIGAKKCVTYERTPKMSTYLVAWAIGEFDYLQARTENGTRVRVFTRPGEVEKVEFALDVATKVLPLFEKYARVVLHCASWSL